MLGRDPHLRFASPLGAQGCQSTSVSRPPKVPAPKASPSPLALAMPFPSLSVWDSLFQGVSAPYSCPSASRPLRGTGGPPSSLRLRLCRLPHSCPLRWGLAVADPGQVWACRPGHPR